MNLIDFKLNHNAEYHDLILFMKSMVLSNNTKLWPSVNKIGMFFL